MPDVSLATQLVSPLLIVFLSHSPWCPCFDHFLACVSPLLTSPSPKFSPSSICFPLCRLKFHYIFVFLESLEVSVLQRSPFPGPVSPLASLALWLPYSLSYCTPALLLLAESGRCLGYRDMPSFTRCLSPSHRAFCYLHISFSMDLMETKSNF